MKKPFLCALSVAVGSLFISGAASAHHGDADRYTEDVQTVTGTVVQVQFVNPHALIVFDVAEGGSPASFRSSPVGQTSRASTR